MDGRKPWDCETRKSLPAVALAARKRARQACLNGEAMAGFRRTIEPLNTGLRVDGCSVSSVRLSLLRGATEFRGMAIFACCRLPVDRTMRGARGTAGTPGRGRMLFGSIGRGHDSPADPQAFGGKQPAEE
jgi:hypothetical protein